MLVETLSRPVAVSGNVMSSKRVELKASADAVRRFILPYTKLAEAAARETINNAFDAPSTRIKITVPSRLDLRFVLRDYGPGITGDYLADFYSIAGHSTKTQTNTVQAADGQTVDVMGCKGVGRFAPLAITDQFFVRSFNAGVCTMVSVYFDADNYPVVDVLSSLPSDEPTGLEVSFAVDPTIVDEFSKALIKAIEWVPDTYHVEFDGTPLEYKQRRTTASKTGTNWFLFDLSTREHTSYRQDTSVLMGRIEYKVPRHSIDELYVLPSGFVLQVPLGAVDVNDAREYIVINDKARKALVSAADLALDEFLADVYDKINAQPTLWMAYHELAKANENCATRDLLNSRAIAYKGVLMDRNPTIPGGFAYRYYSPPFSKTISLDRINFNFRNGGNNNWPRDVSTSSLVFVDDVPHSHRILQRIKHHYETNSINPGESSAYLFQGDAPDLNKVLKHMGDPPVVYLSTVVLPPIVSARSGSGVPAVKRPVRMKEQAEAFSARFNDAEVDLSHPRLYFKTDAGDAVDFQKEFPDIVNFLSKIDPARTELIVNVPKTVWHKIKLAPTWINLTDYVATKRDEFLASNKDAVEVALLVRTALDQRHSAGITYDLVQLINCGAVMQHLFPAYDSEFSYSCMIIAEGYPEHTFATPDVEDLSSKLSNLLVLKPWLYYLVNGNAPDDVVEEYLNA